MSNSGHRGYGGVERHRRLDIAQRQASDPFCFAPLFGPWTAHIMTSSSFFLSFYLFHPISFAGRRRASDQLSNPVETLANVDSPQLSNTLESSAQTTRIREAFVRTLRVTQYDFASDRTVCTSKSSLVPLCLGAQVRYVLNTVSFVIKYLDENHVEVVLATNDNVIDTLT
ncbi:hypothetical protein BC629DRAFT_1077064 [Irpex lacteus]|nr:hypothetical protein BC629DRAFT_1077064 [Irpex lacteus]